MQTPKELDTVWKLFNLLEKLSTILFDQYHEYLIDRYIEEESLDHFHEHILQLISKQSCQNENPSDDTK